MNTFPFDKIFIGDSVDTEILRLKHSNCSVIKFPMRLRTKKEIFAFVKREFTLDPMLGEYLKWDALNDSISGGFYINNQDLVVIIESENFIDRQVEQPNDLSVFLEILFQIRNEQHPIDMKIYLSIQDNGSIDSLVFDIN